MRGLRKRCPRCGDRRIFRSWFQLRDRCLRCDLRFEKEDGGFLGAMTLNYAFAVVVWLVALGLAIAVTVPDIPVVPLLAGSVAILVVVPLWFYPRSKGLWSAVEFLVARSDPDYRSPAHRDQRSAGLE